MLKKILSWPLFVGVGIILSLLAYYVFFNDSIQIFAYDMFEQHMHFLLLGYDFIHKNGLAFWDWHQFMGASMFTYTFYWLMSPFWLIYTILPSRDLIPYAVVYVNLLKLLLLYVFSVICFTKIRKTQLGVFVGSIIITFSGFVVAYFNYSHFIDVFLFLPLTLYFIEVYLEDKKFVGLVLTIALMAFINMYLLILFTFYIFVYTLFRYFSLNDDFKFKDLIIDGLKFVGFFILGVGVSSIFSIPSLITMLGSSRLGTSGSLLTTISWQDAYRYITSFIQPVVDRNNFNPLVNKNIVPSFGWSGGAAIYSLILSPLLLPQLFFMKEKSKHLLGLKILFVFIIVFSLFPNLYFFIQGNNDTRWMVIFSLLSAYSISYLLDDTTRINKKVLLVSTMSLGLLVVSTYYLSRYLGLQNVELYFSIAKRNILIIGVLVVLYSGTLNFIHSNKLKTQLISLGIVLEVGLIIFNIFFNPVGSTSFDLADLSNYGLTEEARDIKLELEGDYNTLDLTDESIIEYIKSYDNSVYRIDAMENGQYNNPMSKDYLGFTFYSSVYNFEIDDFIQNNISSAGGWVVGSNPGKWQFKTMFGSKYFFDTTGFFTAPYGYTLINNMYYQGKTIDIYENNYFIPLMYVQDKTISYDTWLSLNRIDKNRSLMSNVVTLGSNNTNVDYPNELIKLATFGTDTEISFDEIQTNQIYAVEMPRSEELSLQFYLDDELVKNYYTYEPGYSSVYVTDAFNKVIVNVSNLYGVPEEEFVNTLYYEENLDLAYETWYKDMTETQVSDIQLGNDRFSGQVTLNKEAYIVTSISYDTNWNITLNGEKVDYEKVNGGFIGIKVDPGTYKIEGTYFPKILYTTSLTSLISVITLFILTKYMK